MTRTATALLRAGHAAPHWLSLNALVCSAVVAVLVLNLTEFLNPDWFGYRLIYEDDGSWLAEQGRDPLFLLLISASRVVFGADGYDAARSALSAYFIAFSYLLCAGRVLPLGRPGPTLVSLLIALLIFTTTRFTIQIREGLAMTMVLFALRPVMLREVMPARTWVLMGCAVLIHAGTILLLVTLLLSRWALARRLIAAAIHDSMKRLSLFAAVVGGLLAGLVLSAGGTDAVVDTLFDTTSASTGTLLGKFMYWLVMGALIALLAREATQSFTPRSSTGQTTTFVGLLALLVLPAIYSMIIVQLLAGGPLVIISGTARALHLVVAILVMLVSLRRGLSFSAGGATLLLTADQMRVIYESILSTFMEFTF